MSSDKNVVISPEAHKPRLELMKAPVGCTMTEILRCAINEGKFDKGDLPYVEIRVNGKLLPRREDALDRCLLDGEVVQISMAVRGDNPLKTAFQLIVQVTAIVVGFYFGPWAAAAVQVVGALANAALFRNKQDRLADPNSSSALNEQSNTIRRRAPMPLVLGRQRVAFDVAALSYTQNIGNDSWLNVIFGVHYGPCTVEQIKIGETLLTDYPASDIQIEYALNPGPKNFNLYPGNVFQENFNNKLDFVGIPGGTWETITPLPGAKAASVDITLPGGLSYSTDKGKIRNEEVAGQIQIAEVGTENWQAAPFPGNTTARNKNNQLLPPGSFYINMRTANAIRKTYTFNLDPTKNWKVRVRAYDQDNDSADDPGHTWDTYLTALRSHFDGKPIIDENLSCIAIRIKASGDLSNTLPTISGIVTPIVPVYKNGNWETREPSSNQAALLRWCLTDLPAAKPMPASEINASCEAVYNLIQARDWGCALYITDDISQEDLMRLCGLAGRFATYWSGEDLCFVGDWEKPIARQVFSAANIKGYKYRREFQDEIHAVLVEFKNLDEDSRTDEVWVYADGYNASNSTLFETYTLQFACSQNRAYREGRVYLARRELKTETHEWTAGFDSVTSTFGDRVRVSHYAALYGEDTGRVINRILSADQKYVLGVRLDFAVQMEVGQSYSLDVRRYDQALVGIVLEPATELKLTKSVYFSVPLEVNAAPRKDDLVVFGKTNLVTEDVEIDSFDPQSRNEVRISASPYVATLIEAAETGPIPQLPTNLKPKEQTPRVRILQSYGKPEGVEVVFDVAETSTNPIQGFIARWRYSGEDYPWNTLAILPKQERTVRTPPILRPAYDPDDPIDAVTLIDVQIITLSQRGDYSNPTTVNAIQVKKEVAAPTGFDALAVVRTAPDGSSKPAIAVIADPVTAGDIQYLDLELGKIEFGEGSLYESAGSVPASNPTCDLYGVDPGESYIVRARFRTQDNWYSDWVYAGSESEPVAIPGGSSKSSDTVNVGGIPATTLTSRLQTVEGIAAANASAVAELETAYGDTASAAQSAADAAQALSDAILAKADAVIAKGEAQALATTAAQKAIDAAGSASAALTSKNDAAASATTATQKATDAAGSAATATQQAGLAAGSATESGGSALAAAGSASTASTKATEAGNSATAANAAKVAAESARDTADQKATAAAQSASSAATSSTQAGQSASAAQTAKTDAETARAQAQTFRDEASDSADDANGAAATATQQAGLATTARNDAAGSASAALTSRNQASGFATAAETAAAASSASSVTATTAKDAAVGAAIATMPDVIAADLLTSGAVGAPATRPNLPAAEVSNGAHTAPVGVSRIVAFKAVVPWKQGEIYDVTVEVEGLAGSADPTMSPHARKLKADFSSVTVAPTEHYSFANAPVGQTTRRVIRFGMGLLPAAPAGGVAINVSHVADVAFVRFGALVNHGSAADRQSRLKLLTIRNVTAQVAADTSATAAATSAANAAASATLAGEKATASQTSATAADTSRAQAQTAATNAAASETNAAGSASTAASQATLATDARNAADDAAEAAAGSASTASSKADEAGVQASAALASQVSASASRDQALKALLEQGRLNLVRRTRATAGQVVGTSEGLSGWGFSMVGTGSGAQDRQIAVGPLKQNTPYSLSFMARRLAGAGSRPITFDLYPDTLPQRDFDIQSNVWTRYTWENFSSAHADMTLSTVRARFFRPNMEAGINVEIAAIKIEEGATATAWTPSPFDAADSASAAATSASSASASETAAGQSASSASGSATTAATKAGEAQTYSNQASASASSAAGSATTASQSSGTAVTAKNDAVAAKDQAVGAAATAVSQASAASASAASAQISADLAASFTNLSGFNILKNSTFANGLANWNTSSWVPSSPTAPVGPHAVTANNGTNNLTSNPFRINANLQYTLSADFRAQGISGSVVVDVEWLNDSGGHVAYSARIFTPVSANVNFDQPRKSVTFTPPSGATQARVRVFTENVSGLSLNGAAVRQIKLEAGDKPTAWRDDSQLVDINAQLNITAVTAADLATRMAEARFEVTAAAGGNLAQLKIRADSTGSLATLVAQAVSFSNTINGAIVDVMKLIGGSVYITGKLLLGAAGQIELDPAYPLILWKIGSARLAIGQLTNDGLIFWFGPNMPVANMRKNNAGIWMDTSGSSYFGGALSAGTLTNKASTSSLSTAASVETPRFNSNGGPITVVYSITGGWQRSYYSSTNIANQTQSGSVTVELDRSINGGAYQNNVSSFTAAYTVTRNNNGFEPGLGYLISETGGYSGSVTYTDPQRVAQDRQFRARITAFGPTSLGNAPTQQTLSIVAVEQ